MEPILMLLLNKHRRSLEMNSEIVEIDVKYFVFYRTL